MLASSHAEKIETVRDTPATWARADHLARRSARARGARGVYDAYNRDDERHRAPLRAEPTATGYQSWIKPDFVQPASFIATLIAGAKVSVYHTFESANVTKDGSNRVSSIVNQGLGTASVQAVAGNKGLWLANAFNGFPGLQLTTDDFYLATIAGQTACTVIWCMMQALAAPTQQCPYMLASGAGQPTTGVFSQYVSGITLGSFRSGLASATGTNATTKRNWLGAFRVFAATYNNNACREWIDLSEATPNAATQVIPSCIRSYLGCRGNSTVFMEGTYLAYLVTNVELPVADIYSGMYEMKGKYTC